MFHSRRNPRIITIDDRRPHRERRKTAKRLRASAKSKKPASVRKNPKVSSMLLAGAAAGVVVGWWLWKRSA